jgi:hypothetical protein
MEGQYLCHFDLSPRVVLKAHLTSYLGPWRAEAFSGRKLIRLLCGKNWLLKYR